MAQRTRSSRSRDMESGADAIARFRDGQGRACVHQCDGDGAKVAFRTPAGSSRLPSVGPSMEKFIPHFVDWSSGLSIGHSPKFSWFQRAMRSLWQGAARRGGCCGRVHLPSRRCRHGPVHSVSPYCCGLPWSSSAAASAMRQLGKMLGAKWGRQQQPPRVPRQPRKSGWCATPKSGNPAWTMRRCVGRCSATCMCTPATPSMRSLTASAQCRRMRTVSRWASPSTSGLWMRTGHRPGSSPSTVRSTSWR